MKRDPDATSASVGKHGSFQLRRVHKSWSTFLMLGARDYLQLDVVHALQIIPDEEHITIDVPDCSGSFSPTSEPIWQWLDSDWQFPVPPLSTAVTDLETLRGQLVIEAARWEEDQWELFSGPGDEFPSDQVRVVPFGTLLGFDSSLVRVTELGIGKGLFRGSGDAEWVDW